MKIKEVKFVGSFTKVSQCPEPKKAEFAFLGRSNVGKSSLINLLTDRKNIAKVSTTPGKTQLINYFEINGSWYLVDLPGYGYAKVSKKQRASWEGMIGSYLTGRPNLLCVFLLIDVRVPPQAADLEACAYFGERNIPFVIVFTKADKPKHKSVAKGMRDFQTEMLKQWESMPEQFLTSARNRSGREELLAYIEQIASTFGE